MLAAYPQVPTGYDLGVGCAVHSYNGKLFFGLIADTHAAPDVDRLRDFVALSFQELRRSAALKKARGMEHAKSAAGQEKEQAAEPVQAVAPQPATAETVPMSVAASAVKHGKEAA